MEVADARTRRQEPVDADHRIRPEPWRSPINAEYIGVHGHAHQRDAQRSRTRRQTSWHLSPSSAVTVAWYGEPSDHRSTTSVVLPTMSRCGTD